MPDTATDEIATATLDVVGRMRRRLTWLLADHSKVERALAAAVERHVPRAARPDMYRPNGVSARALWKATGLDHAARFSQIPAPTLASEFAAWCLRPLSPSEDWILLDASLPPGTSIRIGDYLLFTPTLQELRAIHPLPCSVMDNDGSSPLPPTPLSGSAFLSLECPDRAVRAALSRAQPFDGRIELEHWVPLLVLTLWSPGITRAECMYEVNRGRRIDVVSGDPLLVRPAPTRNDRETGYKHDRLGMVLRPEEAPSFTAFSTAILQCIDRTMAGSAGKHGGRKKLARRLQAAGTHLLRAAHRTRGREGAHEVSAYELNEVVLHYVIAMEALLADQSDHLDLSRKVQYRAATLFDTDEQRTFVAKLVSRAYTARSKYVHGDDVGEDDLDLDELRKVARAVLLRWLILAAGREDQPVQDAQAIPTRLDHATLSDQVRREEILRPIEEFLTATPAADPVTVD